MVGPMPVAMTPPDSPAMRSANSSPGKPPDSPVQAPQPIKLASSKSDVVLKSFGIGTSPIREEAHRLQVSMADLARDHPARVQMVIFTFVALCEVWTVWHGVKTPPFLFPLLSLVDYGLRIRHHKSPDAEMWWPIMPTMLAALAVDKIQHRPRGDFMKRQVKKLKNKVVLTGFR